MPQDDLGLVRNDIVSLTKSGTGAPGTVDTYTFTLRNGKTFSFQVTNGANGSTGGVEKHEFTTVSDFTDWYLTIDLSMLISVAFFDADYNSMLCYIDNAGSGTKLYKMLPNGNMQELVALSSGEKIVAFYKTSESTDFIPTSRTIAGLSLESDITENALFDKMSIKGRYATLTALQTANPDHGYCYLVEENNHWYYWRGSVWTDGGQFVATSLYARNIVFSNSDNLWTSNNVQNAIEELKNRLVDDNLFYHENSIEVTGKLEWLRVGREFTTMTAGETYTVCAGNITGSPSEIRYFYVYFYNKDVEISREGSIQGDTSLSFVVPENTTKVIVYFYGTNSTASLVDVIFHNVNIYKGNATKRTLHLKSNIIVGSESIETDGILEEIIVEENVVHDYGDIDITTNSASETVSLSSNFDIEANADYIFVYDEIEFNNVTNSRIFVEMYNRDWTGRIGDAMTIAPDFTVLPIFKSGTSTAFISKTEIIVRSKSALGGNVKIKGLKLVKGTSKKIKMLKPDIELKEKIVEPSNTTFIEDNRFWEIDEIDYTDALLYEFIANKEKTGDKLTFSVDDIRTDNPLSSASIAVFFYGNAGSLLLSFILHKNSRVKTVAVPEGTLRIDIQIEPAWNEGDTNRVFHIRNFVIFKGEVGKLVMDSNIISNYEDYLNYDLPILYLTGDVSTMTKANAVNLSYSYQGRTGTATVKWQGSSSLAYPKKNYTIKFDSKFEAKDGWGQQKKYCLKANWIDYSHSRNICGAKIWGTIVKSNQSPNYPARAKALINGGAVDGFPIVVVINGVYQGIYTFNIPKDKWMFGMTGSNPHEAIISAEGGTGCLFTTNPVVGDGGDFEVEYATNEADVQWIQDAMTAIYNAVVNLTPENVDATLGSILDIDSLIDYMLYVATMGGGDNVSHNYLLYTYDGTKWYFSAYDMDGTFGLNWDGKSFTGFDFTPPFHRGDASIYQKMQNYRKQQLNERWEYLHANELSNNNMIKQFYNFISDFPAPLLEEDARKWKHIPSTRTNNVAQIENFIVNHMDYLDKLIKNLLMVADE